MSFLLLDILSYATVTSSPIAQTLSPSPMENQEPIADGNIAQDFAPQEPWTTEWEKEMARLSFVEAALMGTYRDQVDGWLSLMQRKAIVLSSEETWIKK